MLKKALVINYKIKHFTTGESVKYEEYFVPYSAGKLKASHFLSGVGKEYASLFVENGKDNFDSLLNNSTEEVEDEAILPDTANILMDFLYCINAATSDIIFYEPNSALKLLAEIPFPSHLKNRYLLKYNIKANDAVKFWFLNNSFFLNYVGLYTELIKIEIAEIKYAISALIRLYNSSENIDKELANSFLKKIQEMYLLDIDDFAITNRNSIKEGILGFCHQVDACGKRSDLSIEIDLLKFNRFIGLLKKYKGKYIKKSNCFCLVQEENHFFFSFSGMNDNNQKIQNLGKQIQNDLETYFKSSSFTFCGLNDDVLSYGCAVNKKNRNGLIFRKFTGEPKRYGDMKKILRRDPDKDNKLRFLYSCCERKIFPYTTNRNQPLYVFCKYEPCCKCITAVERQQDLHSEFLFLALVKDSHELRRILKKERDAFLKNGILNIYSFF